eukprot:366112-Chlamydomonas_euryale.AAC.10
MQLCWSCHWSPAYPLGKYTCSQPAVLEAAASSIPLPSSVVCLLGDRDSARRRATGVGSTAVSTSTGPAPALKCAHGTSSAGDSDASNVDTAPDAVPAATIEAQTNATLVTAAAAAGRDSSSVSRHNPLSRLHSLRTPPILPDARSAPCFARHVMSSAPQQESRGMVMHD